MTRAKAGELIQAVLVAEIDEFIERLRSAGIGSPDVHREGYESQRTVTYGSLPVKIRPPRTARRERVIYLRDLTSVSTSIRASR